MTNEFLNTLEAATYLRLFDPGADGRPGMTRPSRNKLHQLAFRDPTFPRPRKLGRSSLYDYAELRAWVRSRPTGGPSVAADASDDKPRRGRPAKAKIGGGA